MLTYGGDWTINNPGLALFSATLAIVEAVIFIVCAIVAYIGSELGIGNIWVNLIVICVLVYSIFFYLLHRYNKN